MIYIKKINTCLVRVPKAGSQSLLMFFFKNLYDETTDKISRMPGLSEDKMSLTFEKNPDWPFKSSHITVSNLIDHNIVDKSANFIAVVRNPLEKFLSLYFYFLRMGKYDNVIPSKEHFHSMFNAGTYMRVKEHHIIPQHKFLEFNGETIGNWWSFDFLNEHVNELCNEHSIYPKYKFQHLNKSPGNKSKLINHFYSDDLIRDIKTIYQNDFDLYEETTEKYRKIFNKSKLT
jgi:hypothetical protein